VLHEKKEQEFVIVGLWYRKKGLAATNSDQPSEHMSELKAGGGEER